MAWHEGCKEDGIRRMSHRSKLRCWLRVAIFAIATGVGGAQTTDAKTKAPAPSSGAREPAAAAKETAKSAAEAAKERAKSGPGGAGLQDLIKQLRDNRETMIADHDALAKQLKDATEQEKRTIKEKMERQMKAFEEQQATLHKQIRDEQRRQRQTTPPGKR